MLTIRRATRADAGALARLERDSALVREDGTRVALVRGTGLFDQLELMGDARLFVAEEGGTIVACDGASVHDVCVGGVIRRLVYRHHVRVLPDYRRRGLNAKFSAAILEFAREAGAEGGYVYVDPQNVLVRQWQASPSGATIWRRADRSECARTFSITASTREAAAETSSGCSVPGAPLSRVAARRTSRSSRLRGRTARR